MKHSVVSYKEIVRLNKELEQALSEREAAAGLMNRVAMQLVMMMDATREAEAGLSKAHRLSEENSVLLATQGAVCTLVLQQFMRVPADIIEKMRAARKPEAFAEVVKKIMDDASAPVVLMPGQIRPGRIIMPA